MITEIPRPVAAFLAAEDAKDSAALARCFHEEGVVLDEGREHRGSAAIAAWHGEANERAPYVAEPLGVFASEGGVTVHVRVSGEFPGSPIELRQRFVVEGGRIARLEVMS